MLFSNRTNNSVNINNLSKLINSLNKEGKNIIKLSDSNPTLHSLSLLEAFEILSRTSAAIYQPDPKGLYSAREALAKNFGYSPEDYFLCASTSEAYSWLFKLLCDPGDIVLVPKPGYPLFDALATLDSIRTMAYRLDYSHSDGWNIDIDYLKKTAQTENVKAIIVINPNNPTGSYISSQEKNELLSLCNKQNIALISDEVFYPFAIENNDEISRMDGENSCLCFSLDGLSKQLGLPQAKLAWLRVSGPGKKEAEKRLELIADTYLSAASIPMLALPELLNLGHKYIDNFVCRLRANMAMLKDVFESPDSPYRLLRCSAGWTALLEYPRYKTEEEIAMGLLSEEHISVHPGYFFDMERDGFLALSLILETEGLKDAAIRVKNYIDSLAV